LPFKSGEVDAWLMACLRLHEKCHVQLLIIVGEIIDARRCASSEQINGCRYGAASLAVQ